MIDTEALRKKVIDLAIRGKLTEQLPTDGTAEELYAQIQEEKTKIVKEGKIKKEKPLPAIEADEIPFEIPKNWKWVRLAAIYEINPNVDADNKAQAAFIPMEKISAGYSKEFSYEIQDWEHASKNHTKFQDNDIAFAKISPCFENRKSFIAKGLPNGIGGGTTELIILRQKRVLPEYSYYIVNDQRFIDAGSVSYKGIVGQQRVKTDIVKHYLMPLPPLAEQKRIADKIDEVLAEVDIVDALQSQYCTNLEALKSKIIDAGIRGKLTEQLPTDGTAEELYAQILEEKARLVKEKKIKKDKPLSAIEADEIPFEIPKNWKWVRLSDISDTNIGLTYHPENIVEHGTVVLRSNNIQNGNFDFSDLVEVNCSIRDNQYLKKNDILICARNGSKRLVGKCAIYNGDLGDVSFGAFMAILRTPLYKFIYYYLTTEAFRRYYSNDDSKQINQVTQDILKKAIVPLPPLTEQKRITDKIDEVLQLIR